jgi:hypothetical protein
MQYHDHHNPPCHADMPQSDMDWNQLAWTQGGVHNKSFENGCICCDVQEDLLEEVAALASSGDFDYLVVECTGAANPMPVAEAFKAAMIAKDGTICAAGDGHDHDIQDLRPFSSVAQLGMASIPCNIRFRTNLL